jgi:EAL domain-containing protein (putative c-di-GMP-specific phosphodiesterase class I)
MFQGLQHIFELHHSVQAIVCANTLERHAVEVFSYAARPGAGHIPAIPPVSLLEHPELSKMDSRMFHSCLHAYGQSSRVQEPELLFINLSSQQTLLDLTPDQLTFPERTVIEITEHESLFTDFVRQHMEALAQHGVRFAVDDFGTGFSNLSFVLEHPFHFVKLDKSLTNMASRFDVQGSALLRAMATFVEAFHQAGLKVIAEGIETAEDQQLMVGLGCDYLQGYRFSMPEYLGEGNHAFCLRQHAHVRTLAGTHECSQ